jgi:hypothetical protein
VKFREIQSPYKKGRTVRSLSKALRRNYGSGITNRKKTSIMLKKNNNRTTADKDFKYYTRTFWKIFLLGMVVSFCFSYLPLGVFLEPCLLWRLEKPDSNLATEIISADGVVLGYFQKNRSQLKYRPACQNLVQALVATQRTSVLNTQALTGGNITRQAPWNKWKAT